MTQSQVEPKNRRDFLKYGGAAALGLVVGAGGYYLASSGAPSAPPPTGAATVTQTVTAPGTAIGQLATDVDTMILAMDISGADSNDPAKTWTFNIQDENAYRYLMKAVYPGFATYDYDIAESLTPSSDRLTYTAKIKSGLVFHNGDPITAKDVEYSWKRALGIGKNFGGVASHWFSVAQLTNPDNITAIDDSTFQFKLDLAISQSLLEAVLTTSAFAIVNSKLTESNATGSPSDQGSAWLDQNSAGSGPFILTKWEKSAQMVMVANTRYQGDFPPTFKQVIIQHVAEATSQLTALQTGDIDVAMNPTAQQVVENQYVRGLKASGSIQPRVEYLWMNAKIPPFDNPKVWQAVKWSIDYGALVNQVLEGQAVEWQTASFKGLLGEDPSTPYSKNIAKAKQLLADAGYPNGFSTDVVPGYDPMDIAGGTKIQADLADVGIKINITKLSPSALGDALSGGKIAMLLAGWGGGLGHIENITPAWCDQASSGGFAQMFNWNDPTARDLSRKASAAATDAEAADLYHQLTQYCLNNGPFAVLYIPIQDLIERTWLQHFEVPLLWTYLDISRAYKEKVMK